MRNGTVMCRLGMPRRIALVCPQNTCVPKPLCECEPVLCEPGAAFSARPMASSPSVGGSRGRRANWAAATPAEACRACPLQRWHPRVMSRTTCRLPSYPARPPTVTHDLPARIPPCQTANEIANAWRPHFKDSVMNGGINYPSDDMRKDFAASVGIHRFECTRAASAHQESRDATARHVQTAAFQRKFDCDAGGTEASPAWPAAAARTSASRRWRRWHPRSPHSSPWTPVAGSWGSRTWSAQWTS